MIMAFKLIDIENWERKEFYEHFINEVVCTYSAVVNLDITNLKGQKLYPAMIWLLTKTVNDMPEFRTSLTAEGLGVYDDMHPMYTVFNKEKKNMSIEEKMNVNASINDCKKCQLYCVWQHRCFFTIRSSFSIASYFINTPF